MDHFRVLIIDDNAHVRRLVKEIVAQIPNTESWECADGRAAIAVGQHWRADIALVDYEMQPMNGVAFTEKVRAGETSLSTDMPIVMMTGHADQAHVVRARKAGVNALLAKPLSVGAVVTTLQKMLHAQAQAATSAGKQRGLAR